MTTSPWIIIIMRNISDQNEETIKARILYSINCLKVFPFVRYLLTYLLTHLLTSWSRVLLERLTGSAASQGIPSILLKPKVYYRTHKCPRPLPILSQLHPVLTNPSHFLKIYLNIVLPSKSGFPQWCLSHRFPHQNPAHTSPLPHTRHMHHPSYFRLLESMSKYGRHRQATGDNIIGRKRIMCWIKGLLWVLQHYCLEAYCTLTQMSSFIHLQRRCTHEAAWETSASEGRNYTWNLANNP